MTSITVQLRADEPGLRPLNLSRDLSGVAALMQTCFGDSLDSGARRAVQEMQMLAHAGPLLWLLGAVTPAWQIGYVWIEDGRVIGNVSAQPAERDRRTWLIANVAVHPDHRRRGIATALTQAAMRLASERGARRVLLQVHHDNTAARRLYDAMGFRHVTTRHTWQRAGGLKPPPASLPGIDIRPARRSEWMDEFTFMAMLRPEGFNWVRPPRLSDWRPSRWQALGHFISGNRRERWVAVDASDHSLVGNFWLDTAFGQQDQIHLLVRPEWRDRLERPLLITALRRVHGHPWPLRLDHPAGESDGLFEELGFKKLQTLIWMQKDL